MAVAVRSLSYSGKLVYQRADVLANLAFQHDVINGEEIARLRRLSGQPMERAQSGNTLIEAVPGPNVLRQGYPLPGFINPEPRQIFEAPYQITLGGVERIADRSAQLILVESMDGHRHTYKFWVDEETFLLLRLQTLNSENQTLEQFEFSELSVGQQIVEIAGERSRCKSRFIRLLNLIQFYSSRRRVGCPQVTSWYQPYHLALEVIGYIRSFIPTVWEVFRYFLN